MATCPQILKSILYLIYPRKNTYQHLSMKIPVIEMDFTKGQDDWEFAYLTVSIMVIFYLIPERNRNLQQSVELWERLRIKKITGDIDKGAVFFDKEQSFLFLDGADAISKLLKAGDPGFTKKLFSMASYRFKRFQTVADFISYYTGHADRLLKEVKDQFANEPEALAILHAMLQRWKKNCTYEQWLKKNVQQRKWN